MVGGRRGRCQGRHRAEECIDPSTPRRARLGQLRTARSVRARGAGRGARRGMTRAWSPGRAGPVPMGRRARIRWKAAGLGSCWARRRRRAACPSGYAVVTRGAAHRPPWSPPSAIGGCELTSQCGTSGCGALSTEGGTRSPSRVASTIQSGPPQPAKQGVRADSPSPLVLLSSGYPATQPGADGIRRVRARRGPLGAARGRVHGRVRSPSTAWPRLPRDDTSGEAWPRTAGRRQ
jgi:hypothetical protein